MTKEDLQRGNELNEKIKILYENISLLDCALKKETWGEKIKRFAFSCRDKNKIHIDAGGISFGGVLTVDRECMELIKNYFEKKHTEAKEEFESIGKGGAEE